MPWIIFFSEFLVLFFTSRFLFKSFFALLYALFRSKRLATLLVFIFFLPGVFIHEMAHLLVAELLRVPTYGVEFMPELVGNSLKMGSVKVEKSDFLRSLLVGVAPVIVGILLLTLSMYVLSRTFSYSQIFLSKPSFALTIFVGYVIFVIANTMFSSKKDVEGLFEALLILGVFVLTMYFVGLFPHLWIAAFFGKKQVLDFVQEVSWLLIFPVGINVVVVLISFPILKRINLS